MFYNTSHIWSLETLDKFRYKQKHLKPNVEYESFAVAQKNIIQKFLLRCNTFNFFWRILCSLSAP